MYIYLLVFPYLTNIIKIHIIKVIVITLVLSCSKLCAGIYNKEIA